MCAGVDWGKKSGLEHSGTKRPISHSPDHKPTSSLCTEHFYTCFHTCYLYRNTNRLVKFKRNYIFQIESLLFFFQKNHYISQNASKKSVNLLKNNLQLLNKELLNLKKEIIFQKRIEKLTNQSIQFFKSHRYICSKHR